MDPKIKLPFSDEGFATSLSIRLFGIGKSALYELVQKEKGYIIKFWIQVNEARKLKSTGNLRDFPYDSKKQAYLSN